MKLYITVLAKCAQETLCTLLWSPCCIVNVCLMCSIWHIPRLPSPYMHFLILCNCDSCVFRFVPWTSYESLVMELSFKQSAKWKNLRWLKLECVAFVKCGKFFNEAKVQYIKIYIYILIQTPLWTCTHITNLSTSFWQVVICAFDSVSICTTNNTHTISW